MLRATHSEGNTLSVHKTGARKSINFQPVSILSIATSHIDLPITEVIVMFQCIPLWIDCLMDVTSREADGSSEVCSYQEPIPVVHTKWILKTWASKGECTQMNNRKWKIPGTPVVNSHNWPFFALETSKVIAKVIQTCFLPICHGRLPVFMSEGIVSRYLLIHL